MIKNNNNLQPKLSDPKYIFGVIIKNIKKSLPSACTFLSPYKTSKGEYYVRAIVGGNNFYYTVPEDFVFTQADIDRLVFSIKEKCEDYVSKRN